MLLRGQSLRLVYNMITFQQQPHGVLNMNVITKLIFFFIFFTMISEDLLAREYRVFGKNRKIAIAYENEKREIFSPFTIGNIENPMIPMHNSILRQHLYLISNNNEDVIPGLYEEFDKNMINPELSFEIRNSSKRKFKLNFYYSSQEDALKCQILYCKDYTISVKDDFIPKIIIQRVKQTISNACLNSSIKPSGSPKLILNNNPDGIDPFIDSPKYCYSIGFSPSDLINIKINNYVYDVNIVNGNIEFIDRPYIFIDLNINKNSLTNKDISTITKLLKNTDNYIFLYYYNEQGALKRETFIIFQKENVTSDIFSATGKVHIKNSEQKVAFEHLKRVATVIHERFVSPFTKKKITIYSPAVITKSMKSQLYSFIEANFSFNKKSFDIKNFEDLKNDFK